MTDNRKHTMPRILLIACTSVILMIPAQADAASTDCPSGYLCVWSGSGYSGTMKRFTTTGSYQNIGFSTVRSIYNHRSKRGSLHEGTNGSGRVACFDPNEKAANLTGWQASAKSVYLSTVQNC